MLVSALGSSLVVTPVSQRTIDWLTRGDTAGWNARELAGRNALRLVEGLKAGRVDLGLGGMAVPPDLRRELDAEWSGLTRVGGRLKSMQLLGTTAGAERDEQLSLLRLKFERDSLLYGVGWKAGALAYTQPGTRNVIRNDSVRVSNTWRLGRVRLDRRRPFSRHDQSWSRCGDGLTSDHSAPPRINGRRRRRLDRLTELRHHQ